MTSKSEDNRVEKGNKRQALRGGMNVKKLNWKIVQIVGVVFLALVIFGSLGFYIYEKKFSPVAVINGVTISRSDAKAKAEHFKKFYQYAGDTKSLSDLDSAGRNLIIDDTIVKTESAKRGITVSQAEIDAQYAKQMEPYKTDEAYQSILKSAYGWSVADAKDRIEIKLLKDKLQKAVLNTIDGQVYYARYDVYDNDTAINEAVSKLNDIRGQVVSGVKPEEVKKALDNDPRWRHPFTDIFNFKGLNSVTEKKIFLQSNGDDYKVISKLQKAGDLSSVYKSAAGYYGFAIISSKTDGGYNSWNDFVDAVKAKNAPVISIGLLSKPVAYILSSISGKAYALNCPAMNSGLKNTTSGTCCELVNPSSPGHLGDVYGYVWDNTTYQPLPSAVVNVDYNGNNGNQLCYSRITSMGTHWGTYSGSDGWFDESVNDKMNCWVGYNVTATHAGYMDWGPLSISLTNGGADYYDIYMTPIFTVTPSADTGCNISPNAAQSVAATTNSPAFTGSASSGYTYDGLSIDGGGTIGFSSYTFYYVVSNHSIRAKCTQQYTLHYDPNTTDTVTGVPADQSATAGGSVTVSSATPSRGATYTFGGWNTNSAGTGTDRSGGDSITLSGNVTLYAKWTAVPALSLACPTGTGISATGGSISGSTMTVNGAFAGTFTENDNSDQAGTYQSKWKITDSGGNVIIALPVSVGGLYPYYLGRQSFPATLTRNGDYTLTYSATVFDPVYGNNTDCPDQVITIHIINPDVCNVSPITGTAPLRTQGSVNIPSQTGSYTITYTGPTNYTLTAPDAGNASASFVKILNQIGTYTVTAQRGTGPAIPCGASTINPDGTTSTSSTIKVTSNGSSSGGEVRSQ